ncbi:MAG: TldD/PmbA family protein [Deltaproteobacteria bacterium]|nr:TldD/PmbA family protein [Deltaproteobacteria bacterium]
MAAAGAASAAGLPLLAGCSKKSPGAPPEAGALEVVAAPPPPPPADVAASPPETGYFAQNFGVDRELLRKTIQRGLSKGGDHCEVFLQHKIADFVAFEDGQVNEAYARVDLGAGVRVLLGDQTGYAFSEDLAPESLGRAAETAAAIAAAAAGAPPGTFTPVEVPAALYPTEPQWLAVAPSDKLAIVDAVGKKLAAGDPSVIKAAVRFRAEDDIVLVANSDGAFVENRRPMTFLYVTCTAEKGGRRETNWYSRSSRGGPGFYTPQVIDAMAAEAVKRTMLLFDAVTPPAGEMPVVLAPATSGIQLHEAMGHGFEADFNRKGISIFSSMMGRKIAAEFVTIIDSGLEPGNRGALGVDDEGTPGRRTVLVDKGVLVSYLHDRISAKHYGVERTGNGRREDFRFPPIPRMRVTFMESGPHGHDEIIGSVQKGLYAIDFSNGEVNIGAGDYSFYVKTGYLIEDGKLTSPVKDVNLIGNGPDSLGQVDMVGGDFELDGGTWTCGKDGQGVPVGLGLPTIRVAAITVGGVRS